METHQRIEQTYQYFQLQLEAIQQLIKNENHQTEVEKKINSTHPLVLIKV